LQTCQESSMSRHELHEAKLEVIVDATDQVTLMTEKLKVESNERCVADETLTQQIHNLQMEMQHEKSERGQADSSTRAQLISCLKELATEKEKRVEETQAVYSLVRNFEESFGQHLSEVRLSLESEIQVRVQAGELLERRQRLGTDDSVRLLRQELQQEIAQRIADDDRLRSSIQIEMAFRERTQESTNQMVTKIEQADAMLDKFTSQSVMMKEHAERQMQQRLQCEERHMEERLQREERNLEDAKKREERQMEDLTLSQRLTNLTEQMNQMFDEANAVWQGEVQHLWDALHTHIHDVHLKNPQDGLEASPLERPGCVPNKSFEFARFLVGSEGSVARRSPPVGTPTSRMGALTGGVNCSTSIGNILHSERETRAACKMIARGSYQDVNCSTSISNILRSERETRAACKMIAHGSYQDHMPLVWGN